MSRKKKDEPKEAGERYAFDPVELELFMADIKKEGGIEVTELTEVQNSQPNKTGSASLDLDLITPFPEGGIIEIYGDEGSGKSTLALEGMGQAIAAGKVGLYIDQERALQRSLVQSIRTLRPYVDAMFTDDKEAARKCPIKILRASSGEKALESARRFAVAFPGSFIVIDSVDALVPEAKLAGNIGDQSMGGNARLMSEALRTLVYEANGALSTIAFINQKRDKLGIFFGDPSTTTGGRGLKFYAWQRIELLKPSKDMMIKDTEGVIVGHRVRYKIYKNKLAPTTVGAPGDYPLLYGKGIWRELELIEQCMKFGVIQSGGKGGKQAIVPVIDKDGNDTGECKVMSRFNASRLLLADSRTATFLSKQLDEFMEMMKKVPTDETLDPQGS